MNAENCVLCGDRLANALELDSGVCGDCGDLEGFA
jgi:hypothetical protein